MDAAARVTPLVTWAKDAYWVGYLAVLGVILLIGAILLFARPRWGRRWILATVVGFWWASTPLGSMLLSAPLVSDFHALQDPRERVRPEPSWFSVEESTS